MKSTKVTPLKSTYIAALITLTSTFNACFSAAQTVNLQSPSSLIKSTANAAKNFSIEINKAKKLDAGDAVTDVFIANPNVADIQSVSGNSVFIYGKKVGMTTLFLTMQNGTTTEFSIQITQNISLLKKILQKSFPQESISVLSSPQGIILMGQVSSSKIIKDAQNLAEQFIEENDKVVNNLSLSSSNQVYLKVKIAEVNRTVFSKISPSLALNATGNKFSFATLTGRNPAIGTNGIATAGATGSVAGSIGFRFNDGVSDHSSLFDMLDKEGLGTILAEPNLVALSGQKASFLAGGEISYPVPQDNNNITIEFKPYGISLEFVPTVLSPDLINLRVTPEVSELDATRTSVFQIAGQSVSVPSIKTRRVDTSVELSSGQSFAIAGLLSHNISNSLNEVPGLSKLPVLGSLFTSTQFERNETELVIIVTPYLVKPTENKNLKVPTNGIVHAAAVDTLFSKKLNKTIKASAPQTHAGKLHGSAGFHIES